MEELDKIFCAECNLEKESKFCKRCQKETPNLFKVCISEEIKSRESIGIKQKRPGFKGFFKKVFSGFKPSKDPRLPEGVDIQMEIDREKKEYHQVVRNNKTGKILHEEHELLTDHKSKNKK